MASYGGPFPPPAPLQFQPPQNGGQQQQQQQRPQGQQGPPPGQFMAIPIRRNPQRSTRIQDIAPPKLLDDAACLKKLTSYAAFTIRKVPPRDAREKPSWSRAVVTEEQFSQEDTLKQIKKLNESKKTVSEKKAALAQLQEGQITRLLDDLGSKEMDQSFQWSLVQIDQKIKPVSSARGTSKKQLYETVTMTVFVKRAPLRDLNPIQLYESLEWMKQERLRPPPLPQQQLRPPHEQQDFGGGHGGGQGAGQGDGQGGQGGNQNQGGGRPPSLPPSFNQNRPPPPPLPFVQIKQNGPSTGVNRSKPQVVKQQKKGGKPRTPMKYHGRGGSSSGSSASDSDDGSYGSSSGANSSDEESMTTISSGRPKQHRRHSKGAYRSSTYHHESRPKYRLEARSPSPHRYRAGDAFGGIPAQHRPYVPDVPRGVPAIDPITSAYQAGKEDAMAERFGAERHAQQPQQIVQPIIERFIKPRPVVSYSRMEPHLVDRPRLIEPRFIDERYADDLRSIEDEFIVRRRQAEEYMDRRHIDLHRRPLEPREFLDRPTSDFERRAHERPGYLERRHNEARPFERREAPQDTFDRSPPFGREFPRHHSPPRFPGDCHPFTPIPLARRFPIPSSSSSSQGW